MPRAGQNRPQGASASAPRAARPVARRAQSAGTRKDTIRVSVLVVHSIRYHIDIGTHVFPTAKYSRVVERLQREGPHRPLVRRARIRRRGRTWRSSTRRNTCIKLQTGAFTIEELALLEVPWSPEIVEGFRLMTGGTILAGRAAAGGEPRRSVTSAADSITRSRITARGSACSTTSPSPSTCSFRDGLASSAAVDRSRRPPRQRDGVHLRRDPRVFTFSMHQQHNYPMHKPRGSLDIGLADRTQDDEYLTRSGGGAADASSSISPDIVFYLAGADPYRGRSARRPGADEGGTAPARSRGAVTLRTRMVCPSSSLLAGGYARKLEDTVDIHLATIQEASLKAVTRPA